MIVLTNKILSPMENKAALHIKLKVEHMGIICCYATLNMSDNNPTLLVKLSRKYKIIAQFMVDNKLKLYVEKTHLLVMRPCKTTYQVRTGIIPPNIL